MEERRYSPISMICRVARDLGKSDGVRSSEMKVKKAMWPAGERGLVQVWGLGSGGSHGEEMRIHTISEYNVRYTQKGFAKRKILFRPQRVRFLSGCSHADGDHGDDDSDSNTCECYLLILINFFHVLLFKSICIINLIPTPIPFFVSFSTNFTFASQSALLSTTDNTRKKETKILTNNTQPTHPPTRPRQIQYPKNTHPHHSPHNITHLPPGQRIQANNPREDMTRHEKQQKQNLRRPSNFSPDTGHSERSEKNRTRIGPGDNGWIGGAEAMDEKSGIPG